MKLLGITLGSWLPWRLAGRIRALSSALDRIGSGDLSTIVPLSEDDIIGSLGARINGLASSLSVQMNRLRLERTQLETIIDNMSEGVAVTDAGTVLLLANQAWYRTFGSSPKSLGSPILESVRVPHIFDSIRNSTASRMPSETEFGIGDRFFIARSVPFETAGVLGCVTVVSDTTRMKSLENIRRDFTANVSHQMKTPLTSILGYSETLLSGALDDPAASRRFIETIHEQAVKLRELIEDVMELARIESPMFHPELVGTDLRALLENTVNDFSHGRKNVRVILDCGELFAVTDRKAVSHIVHNLVDNAVKYSYDGGDVMVKAFSDGANIYISVTDKGVGISEEDTGRIFERFYRANGSDRTSRDGTGLGLAITKHLVEKLNGRIDVTSRPGCGSTFTVTLPV